MVEGLDTWVSIPDLKVEDRRTAAIKRTLENLKLKNLAKQALQCRSQSEESVDSSLTAEVSIDKFAFGRFNTVLIVQFSDEVRWAVRIPILNDDTKPADLARSMESEVATMRLVKARTTIPLPTIRGFSPIHSDDIGAPYIFMDFVQGHHTLKIFAHSVPEKFIAKVARQLGSFIFQLSALQFECIGRITEPPASDETDSSFSIEPTDFAGTPISQLHNAKTSRTLASSLEYFYQVRQDLNKAALDLQRDPADKSVAAATQFVLQAIPAAILPAHLNGPFPLGHPDMHYNNILVDSAFNITAVLDWSDLTTVPVERLAANPEFTTFPGRSKADNELIIQFRQEVRRAVQELAEGTDNQLARSLGEMIGSPQAELCYRLLHTTPYRAKYDPLMIVKLLYGENAKWPDLEKLIIESPMMP